MTSVHGGLYHRHYGRCCGAAEEISYPSIDRVIEERCLVGNQEADDIIKEVCAQSRDQQTREE